MLIRASLLAFVCVALSACAHSSVYEPSDPLEKINRPVYAFNMTADRYVLRPVAKTYVSLVPQPVRTGLSNALDNFFYPTTIVNDLLQGKFVQSGKDTARFVLNSTVGLAGLLDVATSQGLPKNNEDLGQTFGRWGVGEGWYLMLPLLGPTTNRDLVGNVGDNWTQIVQYLENSTFEQRVALAGVQAVDGRAQLLGADELLKQQLDPYVFVRSIYLQRRQSLVYDGNPPPDLGDEEEEAK